MSGLVHPPGARFELVPPFEQQVISLRAWSASPMTLMVGSKAIDAIAAKSGVILPIELNACNCCGPAG